MGIWTGSSEAALMALSGKIITHRICASQSNYDVVVAALRQSELIGISDLHRVQARIRPLDAGIREMRVPQADAVVWR